MTDKEKRIFEEWFEEKKENCEVYGNGDDFWVDDEIKKFCLMGYELGLKAGRPQWHDLRKDPNDLPEKMGLGSKEVYVAYENGITDFACYRFDKKCWERSENEELAENVVAWCEIPHF